MAEHGTLLHGKVGGVPTWGIAVGLAGALILVMVVRNRKAASSVPPQPMPDSGVATQPSNPNDQYGLPSGPIGGWLGSNPTAPGYPVGLTPRGVPGPITNAQWSRLAFDELVAKGDDPTLVGTALAKFLAGSPRTAAEEAVIRLAQQMFGAPPEGLIATPPPATTPPPVTTDPPATVPPRAKLPSPVGFKDTGSIWTDSLELHWDPVPGAVDYRVKDGSGKEWNVGNITAVMRNNLLHNGSYFMQIAAVDANGQVGEWSPTLTSHTKN